MARLTVPVVFEREITVQAPLEDVFAFLADFPQALAEFPKTESIEVLEEGALKWVLDKLGPPPYQQKTVYPIRYGANEDEARIWWEPAPELDAGPHADDYLTGSCTLTENGSGTKAVLEAIAELNVEVPFFAKKLAPPIVRTEFERLTEKFVTNLQAEVERIAG